MCGIVGIYLRNAPCDPAVLTRMRDIIAHRGPDDADSFIAGGMGIGHRRLSIIDLGGGHQPMSTPDGRYTIVYNGEIYNYRELRQSLESQGAQFRTSSDTEVILQLHALGGNAAISRLNGMFAYALWDRDTRKLTVVRDRAGIKPLYYAVTPAGAAFSSEIKSLFESGLVSPRVAGHHVAEYLTFRQVAGPENLFEGVLALPPGHFMELGEREFSAPRSFMEPQERPQSYTGSFESAVDALDACLRGAVERQMIADVPLGTFCSGGIDSSLITAMAARIAGNRRINTFSVGFHEADFDESAYARLAAESCGTDHHEIRIDEKRFAELLPKLVWHHDLPLNFANSVHIFAVSELARSHVKVVLTGEGADELFGGYPRYYIPRLVEPLRMLPRPLRAGMIGLLDRMPDHRLRKLGSYARHERDEILLYNSTGTDPEFVRGVARHKQATRFEFRRRTIASARAVHGHAFGTLSQLDFETYLVSILNRQDKMSMATSLESRVPFLDNEVIDFARTLPAVFKQTLRSRKRILKEVALRYLPSQIVHRRKSGFGVPLAQWFRGTGPMATALLESVTAPGLERFVEVGRLRSALDEHRSGAADHSEVLWGILNLSVWLRTFRC